MTTFQEDAQTARKWMIEADIPLVYPTETKEELEQIWKKWNELSDDSKARSDEKSIEIFGMDNASHYDILGLLYV